MLIEISVCPDLSQNIGWETIPFEQHPPRSPHRVTMFMYLLHWHNLVTAFTCVTCLMERNIFVLQKELLEKEAGKLQKNCGETCPQWCSCHITDGQYQHVQRQQTASQTPQKCQSQNVELHCPWCHYHRKLFKIPNLWIKRVISGFSVGFNWEFPNMGKWYQTH